MANSPKVNKTQQYKKALIAALGDSWGVVTKACEIAGLDRTTFYNYYNSDPEFKAAADEAQEAAMDKGESKLLELVDEKNPAAVIFYAKTKLRKRGYIERHEHTGADGQALIPEKITIEIISDTPPVTNEEDIIDPTE